MKPKASRSTFLKKSKFLRAPVQGKIMPVKSQSITALQDLEIKKELSKYKQKESLVNIDKNYK